MTTSREVSVPLNDGNRVSAILTPPWQKKIIEGADHSFGLVKSDPRSSADVYADILDTLLQWLSK